MAQVSPLSLLYVAARDDRKAVVEIKPRRAVLGPGPTYQTRCYRGGELISVSNFTSAGLAESLAKHWVQLDLLAQTNQPEKGLST